MLGESDAVVVLTRFHLVFGAADSSKVHEK